MGEIKEILKPIVIDLKSSIIDVTLEDGGVQFSVYFNTDPRRFYLAVIALVVHKMKEENKIRMIEIKEFYEYLVLFNKVFSQKKGSEVSDDEWRLLDRIYKKWRYTLPKLEKGKLFSVVDKDRTEFSITKTKLYDCSLKECEVWKKLFIFKGSEIDVSLCFSIDQLGIGLDDIVIKYDGEKDAWKRFIDDLKSKKEITPPLLSSSVKEIKTPKSQKVSQKNQKQILDQYLKQVEIDYRDLDTKHFNIMLPKNKVIKLDDIYVDFKATDEIPGSEASYVTKYMKDLIGVSENYIKDKKIFMKDPSSSPIKQIVHDNVNNEVTSKKHMVFLGRPGSGKSTLLRYLAYLVASGEAHKWGLNGFIPFFIDLKYYIPSKDEDIIDYALREAVRNIDPNKKEDMKAVLRETINDCRDSSKKDGRVVFLLDALDETRIRREKIVNEIEKLRNRYINAFIIVTSRTTGYSEIPINGFIPYLIEDLQPDEISNFVNKWFQVLADKRNQNEFQKNGSDWTKERANFLIRQIEDKASLRRICSCPQYLTFLILLASNPDLELPETRADLFDLFFHDLIFKWEKKHHSQFSQTDLLNGFKEISWVIHRSLFGDIKSDPTEQFIQKSIGNSITINFDQLFNFWIETGILIRVKTRYHKELILPRHLSFLEYAFGFKLADLWENPGEKERIWNKLKKNLHNKYLHEPLLFFVGKISDSQSLFKRIWKLRETLFYNNLIFLCHAARETKNTVMNEEIVDKLLVIYGEGQKNQNPFAIATGVDILICIGLMKGGKALEELLLEWPEESGELLNT